MFLYWVIYPNLSWVEAQKHLKEMKCHPLSPSSVNSKDDHSVYPMTVLFKQILGCQPAHFLDLDFLPHNMQDLHQDFKQPTPASPYSGFLSSLPELGTGDPFNGLDLLPISEFSYLDSSSPSLELHTGGPLIFEPEPDLQPNLANVNIGYTGSGQPDAIGSMRPSSNNVNTISEGPGYPGIEETTVDCQESSNLMPSSDPFPGTYSSYSSSVPEEDRGSPRTYSSYRDPVPADNLAHNESLIEYIKQPTHL